MRYKILLIFPALLSVGLLVFDLIWFGGDSSPDFRMASRWLSRSMAILGCLAAMLTFKAKEYLWYAWSLIGLCHILLTARDAIGLTEFASSQILSQSLGVLANLAYIAGIWLLADAWRVAEIELTQSRRAQQIFSAGALMIALSIVGPMAVKSFIKLWSGDISASTGVAAGVADTLGFFLIARLVLTALALRGGLLAWPWIFYSISQFMWLPMNAVFFGSNVLQLDSRFVDLAAGFFRRMACGYLLSSGLAQRFVVKNLKNRKLATTK